MTPRRAGSFPPESEVVLYRDVRERIDGLEAALEKIADIAPGYGDVCEIIARIARAALSQSEPKP